MASARSILTIEDDTCIRRGIVDALRYHGFRALESGDGHDGLQLALESEYDLLLLDLALPSISGMEVLRQVRAHRPTQPVIILTAKGQELDRVSGLKAGADDYVVKPFSVRELVARIEAVLRRTPERPGQVRPTRFGSGVIDFERRELRYDDTSRTELSEKEMELLRYLVAHHGRAISRDELLSSVWKLSPQGIATRTIDMHIARLREKLKENRDEPSSLLTVRGKGYMWAYCVGEASSP